MSRKIAILPLLLLLCCSAADIPDSSREAIPLLLGEQHNFTLGQAKYVLALVGLTQDTATFTVSGRRVSPGIAETKILDLTSDGTGDVGVMLNQIMPNSTVEVTLNYNTSGGEVCKPIGEKCIGFSECCDGKCIMGACGYLPTVQANATVNVSLDAPENATLGMPVGVRLSMEDGSPVAGAAVDVITPYNERLTFTTNVSGEGSFLAAQEGTYRYVVYDYLVESNRTTLSGKAAPPVVQPPQQPFCGDKICSNGENCSTCSKDCGQCVQQPAQTTESTRGQWFIWMGVMFVAIAIVLRGALPLFVKDE